MATRDVIFEALQDWRLTAPLYLQSALNAHELGLLAEVAARAVEVKPTKGVVPVTMYAAVCGGCGVQWKGTDYEAWSEPDDAITAAQEYSDWQKQDDGQILCWDCRLKPGGDLHEDEDDAPSPVGTPAEADACAGRSGLGEVG